MNEYTVLCPICEGVLAILLFPVWYNEWEIRDVLGKFYPGYPVTLSKAVPDDFPATGWCVGSHGWVVGNFIVAH